MYNIKAILDKQPVAIAAGLRSILYVLVLTHVVNLGPDGADILAGIALGAETILNLFVWNAVKPVASAMVDEAQAFAQGAEVGAAALVGDSPIPRVRGRHSRPSGDAQG